MHRQLAQRAAPLLACGLFFPPAATQGPVAPGVRVCAPSVCAPALEAVHVEAQSGRVELARDDRPQQLLAPYAQVELDPSCAASLEVGAGAYARVSWPGRASARIEGPARLSWKQLAEAELEWRLADLGRVDVEVRQGRVRLQLVGGWSARLDAGAFHVERSAGGGALLANLAGGVVPVHCQVGPSSVRPVQWLAMGGRLQLSSNAALLARSDASRRAPPWPDAVWPWSAPDAQAAAATAAALEAEHARALAQAESARAAQPAVAAAREPYDAGQWHGLPREAWRAQRGLVLEASDELQLTSDDLGRANVRLAASAAGTRWCLTRENDYLLSPGALLILDERGWMAAHVGTIHIEPPPETRPSFAELEASPKAKAATAQE